MVTHASRLSDKYSCKVSFTAHINSCGPFKNFRFACNKLKICVIDLSTRHLLHKTWGQKFFFFMQ